MLVAELFEALYLHDGGLDVRDPVFEEGVHDERLQLTRRLSRPCNHGILGQIRLSRLDHTDELCVY